MDPALGRGLIVFWRAINPPDCSTPLSPLVSAEIIYLALFLAFAFKFGKLKHLAAYIALVAIIVTALRFPIGNSETVQIFLTQAIKW
jgi:hypothetical protein